jgi:glyoxylase-like metal-dependent hydrolase (beta-lactamase superfamily II)
VTRCRSGIRAFESLEANDLVIYVESRRAVVVGDTLIDRATASKCIPTGRGRVSLPRKWSIACALLDLPITVVLPTHADPADRAALERALSA